MACNHNCDTCSENCSSKNKKKSLLEKPNKYSSVKKVIAVMSGKGGVGKSMVTALLASLMSQKGYETGVLDADITGPSIPRMFGVHERGHGTSEGLLPSVSKGGVKLMSSQLLLENENDPVVWRGSLISGLVKQFWTDVIWEDVDYLFVDMPPGTGDVPLTVFQSIGVDGIIIVTSPQELVKMIVEKAVKMANMMNVPIIGIVENMSYIKCPDCEKHIEVFGPSHVDEISKEFNIPVLAKMPIDYQLTKASDKGELDDVSVDYLDSACDILASLPVKITNVAVMVKDEEIALNFEEANEIFVYSVVREMVVAGRKFKVLDNSEIYKTLVDNQVHTVICNKIGTKLCEGLESDGFELIIECEGDPLDAVRRFLQMEDSCDGDCEHCHDENCDHSSCDGDCEHCSSDCDHKH